MIELPASSPDSVDWSQPVNWSHPLNRGLVAWWLAAPRCRGGAVWRDLLGRHHGTLTNMDPATDWQATSRPGGWGQLVFSAASSQRVQTTSPGVTGTGPRTAVLWFRTSDTDSTPDANQCVSWGDPAVGGSSGGSFRMPIENGVIYLRVNGGATSWGSGYNDGVWHRLAVTAPDSATLGDTRCYVDGVDLGSGSGTRALNTVATRDVRIGTSPTLSPATFEHFDGEIGDVRVFDRHWSAADAAADYSTAKQYLPGLLNRMQLPWYVEPPEQSTNTGAALLMAMIGQ